MMNFITAKEAKEKADNSEKVYKIILSSIYSNIQCKANQGWYNLEFEENMTSFMANRVYEELKNSGYSVSYKSFNSSYTFYISWKYPEAI